MEMPKKSDFVLPEKFINQQYMIFQWLIAKIAEERFEHWGFMSFSEPVSKLIRLSLADKVSEN